MTELNIRKPDMGTETALISNASRARKLATSVQKLGELREQTESSANAMGSMQAEAAIVASIPTLALVVEGSLKASRNGGGLESRIAPLSPEQIAQTQDQIEMLLGTVLALGSLSKAKRLEAYLPVVLPQTQAGFKTLRLIAEQFTQTIPILKGNNIVNIPEALKTLTELDEQVRTAGLQDPAVVAALDGLARQQAQFRLEKSKIGGSEQVAQIRADIAQQKISALKREPVEVPGTNGYSKYEVLANRIIERDNLFSQVDSAREQAEMRLEKEREAILKSLAKRRAIDKVLAAIDRDPLLCQALAKRSRLSSEELFAAEPNLKRRIANNALDAKMIVLSVEDRRTFKGDTVIAEERAKLTQALLDPLSFIARLTEDELSVIRCGVTKISGERSVYMLAGDILRKQLEAEVTDDEIITVLTRKLLEELLSARVPNAVDTALTELGIDETSVLKDPSKLDQIMTMLVARGLEVLIAASQEEITEDRVPTITETERKRQREAFLTLVRSVELKSPTLALEARLVLDRSIQTPEIAQLGTVVLRQDIRSTLGPFQIYPEYKTIYPPVVTLALENLYAEYNQAFRRLIAANKEWATDYQYCLGPDGTPINSFVQIDMVGLPAGFLTQAQNMREEDVRAALRGRIFEIENSLAMYSLLENFFSDGTSDTFFKKQFLAGLENIRQRFGRPIALLAVTDQKYQAMRATEFGKRSGEPLTDKEVKEFSGFDRFFSPEDFKKHLAENGGQCDYLLYVRSSDPVANMKRPGLVVDDQLLTDDNLRRISKANTLTFNIDNPNLPIGDSRRINDTKEYLGAMGMAFAVFYSEDLASAEFNSYARSQGVDPNQVASGGQMLRAKPMKGTYGGYGHFRGSLGDARFRRELKDALLKRGSYVVQPELQNPTLTNLGDGQAYIYIDRVFFSSDGQSYRFMGGERTLMPIDSNEAQNNRVHGNSSSVYAEIL